MAECLNYESMVLEWCKVYSKKDIKNCKILRGIFATVGTIMLLTAIINFNLDSIIIFLISIGCFVLIVLSNKDIKNTNKALEKIKKGDYSIIRGRVTKMDSGGDYNRIGYVTIWFESCDKQLKVDRCGVYYKDVQVGSEIIMLQVKFGNKEKFYPITKYMLTHSVA